MFTKYVFKDACLGYIMNVLHLNDEKTNDSIQNGQKILTASLQSRIYERPIHTYRSVQYCQSSVTCPLTTQWDILRPPGRITWKDRRHRAWQGLAWPEVAGIARGSIKCMAAPEKGLAIRQGLLKLTVHLSRDSRCLPQKSESVRSPRSCT